MHESRQSRVAGQAYVRPTRFARERKIMSFIEKYIGLLIQNSCIPKFQTERAISSILQLYIEDIACYLTKKDFKNITIELPLPINGSDQSTNIDYMLYSTTENCILVIELKTERQGNDHHLIEQLEQYRVFKENNDISKQILRICVNHGKNRRASHGRKHSFQKERIAGLLIRGPNW